MSSPWVIWTILTVQIACTLFFLGEIAVSVLGLRMTPIDWRYHEFIEIGAAIALVAGVVLGAVALVLARRQARAARDQLRAASGAFMELLDDRFTEWALTQAERDVALFVVKGLSTREVARLRNTSEGTVKAQTNAIYRKSGVSSRAQLVSLFIDDLMSESLI